MEITCWFILPPLFLAVIAEASRSMRYGTGSIAETAIRDLILITAHFCPAQFNDLRARGKQHCGNFLTTDPSHVVIAEARAHTRYGTGSVVAVGYPRSPHIAVISTPAGSHICSSDSCDGKAMAEFLWFDRLTNHAKTVTAHNLADNNNFISRIQYFLLSLWDNKNNKNIIYG